jgi:NAD(P)-dependent dehydrogenase (short-subunit alcohol dehydrogenase family)/acyl carrier protein
MDLVAVRERCTERVPAPKPHSSQSEPATSNAEALWRGQEESLARVSVQSDAVQARLLDLCPDVLAAALGWERKEWFMSGFDAFRRHREVAGSEFWIHAVSTTEGTGTVRVADASGNVLCEIEGMHLETAARALKHQTQREGAQNEADHRNLLYRREWTPVELRPKPGNAGAWLIFADRAGLSAQLAAELQAAGATCKLIFDAPVLGKVEVQLKTDTALRGVLYLRSLDLPPEDVSLRKQIGADVLAIIQALASSGTESSPRLWVVTSGAMPVLSEERTSVAQTPVWGLGQAIAAEHPQLWGGLLDLAPEPALRDHDARNVWSAIEGAGDEHMLALRGQQAYALRIVRDTESLAHSGPAQRPLQLDGDATYLVTGRLGGLGMHLATRLRERGARHIALLGRSEPLRVSGHDSFFRCDLSDFESTDAAIREIERTLPPLKGVFHLAGTLDDGLLLHQDPERFHASGTGKAEGAWNLHKATESSPLDYFVMYSTVATLLTVPGQGSYAAANIVLDALAHRRRAEGKPALCVNWGPWEQLGMTATNYGRAANERLAAAGIAPLDPELALDLLEQLLGAKTTQSAVARINWARLFAGDPRSAISPLLSAFRLESAAAASEAPVQQETELTRKLRACPRTDRPDLLRATLAGMLAESLRLPDAIAPSQSFFDLGVDSILALEFTNRLSVALGRSFPGTLLFTSPTVGALADRLLDEMAAVLGGSEQGTSHPEQPPAPATSVPAPSPDETANEEELSRLIAEEISSR